MSTERKKIEIGDCVMLKGGSRRMTVTSTSVAGGISCTWHSNKGEAQDRQYPEEVLRVWVPPDNDRHHDWREE